MLQQFPEDLRGHQMGSEIRHECWQAFQEFYRQLVGPLIPDALKDLLKDDSRNQGPIGRTDESFQLGRHFGSFESEIIDPYGTIHENQSDFSAFGGDPPASQPAP